MISPHKNAFHLLGDLLDFIGSYEGSPLLSKDVGCLIRSPDHLSLKMAVFYHPYRKIW